MTHISVSLRLELTKFIEYLSIKPTEGFCVFDFGISSLIKLTHEQNICAARFFFRFPEPIPKNFNKVLKFMLFLNIQIFTVLITYAQHIRVLFSKYPR